MKYGIVAVLALAGCHKSLDEQSATALEGFSYGWQHFNHRLSHLQVQMGPSSSTVAVVGGTSTTNEPVPDLPDSCNEFPAPDTADLEVHWAKLTSTATALATGSVHLEVGRDGASGTAKATLPDHAPEVGTAILNGLVLSSVHELAGGPSTYNPAYGWQPNEIGVELGKVTIGDDGAISVPVSATFSAGKTFDPDRVCIDDVNDQAIVNLDVDVLFLAGDGEVVDKDVTQGATYEFSGNKGDPEEQPDPSPVALDFGVDPTLVGFAALDFRFDPDRTDDRGAYLRTLGFTLDAQHAPDPVTAANITATNYSPGTQLQDFGFRFEGVARAVTFDLEAKEGTSTASLPAKVDEQGIAVVTDLPH